jgi:tetratricopeptide (TPR) repeat protein
VTDLSRIPGLRVIAFSSSSRFRGPDPNVAEIGQTLGATHLVRGTFQSNGDKFRVNARLIEVESNRQIWAEGFERPLDKMFSSQGEIARHVSSVLSVALQPGQDELVRITPQSLATRALYRQALTLIHPPDDPARFVASRALFNRIIELEPESPHGYAGLSYIRVINMEYGHVPVDEPSIEEIDSLAATAIKFDARTALAYITKCRLATLLKHYERAVEFCRVAVEKQPSNSLAHATLGVMLVFSGRAPEGVKHIQEALLINPASPRTPYLNMLGVAHFHAGNYEAAREMFQRNLARGGPIGPHMLVYGAATSVALGDKAEEDKILHELRKFPSLKPVTVWLNRTFRDPKDTEKLSAILDKIS